MDQRTRDASTGSSDELDGAMRAFMESALSGALALFSPLSARADAAIGSFKAARQACLDSLAPRASRNHLAGHMHPLACRLVARRALAFDAEALAHGIELSPAATRAWREAFVDAFEASSASMDEKGRVMASGDGPAWLVEMALARKPVDEPTAWLCASLFAKGDFPKWAHAFACSPKGVNIFSFGPRSAPCLALRLAARSERWDAAKSSIADSFERSFSPPERACDSIERSMQSRFWDQPGNAASVALSLSLIGPAPFDSLAALLAHCSSPAGRIEKLSLAWAEHCAPGSLAPQDALFALLWAPARSLAASAHIVERAATPSLTLLHAGLTRLAGAPLAARGALAARLLLWAEALASQAPAALAAPSLRGAKGSNLKTLSANALELALRAALQNKTAPGSAEGLALRSIMDLCIEQGASLDAPGPHGSPTTQAKLALSKSPESRPWLAWAESIEIQGAVGSSPTLLAARPPRL